MFPHPRAYYRIRYPLVARPDFVPLGDDPRPLAVVDCSEKGFRFVPHPGPDALPLVGDPVEGDIHFRSGTALHVSGEVVRIQEGEVAVHLTGESIPFHVVMQEQLFLRRRYPFADG